MLPDALYLPIYAVESLTCNSSVLPPNFRYLYLASVDTFVAHADCYQFDVGFDFDSSAHAYCITGGGAVLQLD